MACDALGVTVENEVYTLLGSWLYQSPYAGAFDGLHPVTVKDCLPLFHRLVKLVRLPYLSLEFVANVITACPLIEESGLLPSILRSSLATREADPNVVAEWRGIDPVPRDRGRGGLEWTYTSTLELTDLLSLAEERSLDQYMGLVDGYPMFIRISKVREQGGTKLGLFVGFMCFGDKETEEDKMSRCASFEFILRAEAKKRPSMTYYFESDETWGFLNFFEKSWEGVVYEGSEHFSDGMMTLRALRH